ncbi:hypothetical protein GA0115260_111641, partial [Streptomyces sp. MnatMP-M27]
MRCERYCGWMADAVFLLCATHPWSAGHPADRGDEP